MERSEGSLSDGAISIEDARPRRSMGSLGRVLQRRAPGQVWIGLLALLPLVLAVATSGISAPADFVARTGGNLDRLLLVMLAIGAAAVVKGAISLGFPLVATPIIAHVLDARSAVIIVSVAQLFGNVVIVSAGGGNWATFGRLTPVTAGLTVGTAAGAVVLVSLDPAALGIVLGACALGFVATAIFKPTLAVPSVLEHRLGLPIGLLAGLLGGSTNAFGLVLGSYLQCLRLEKREFAFFAALLFLIGGVVQGMSYARLDIYDAALVPIVAISCIPNALGLWLGLRLQAHIDPVWFRHLVLTVILILGLNLIAAGFKH